jgi:DNA-binding transcriptional ArsR family regulator
LRTEPNRTQIVCALLNGPLSVTEIAEVIGRARSVTSQHLRILREAGILMKAREGRVVRYALSGDAAARSAAEMVGVMIRAAS